MKGKIHHLGGLEGKKCHQGKSVLYQNKERRGALSKNLRKELIFAYNNPGVSGPSVGFQQLERGLETRLELRLLPTAIGELRVWEMRRDPERGFLL